MDRRRMLLFMNRKHQIFEEGKNELQNTSGNAEFAYAGIKNGYLYIRSATGTYVGSGNPFAFFGKFRIPVNFTGYKKLFIDAEGFGKGRAAVGFGKTLSMSDSDVVLPSNYAFVPQHTRNIYQFDISSINEVQFVCATVTALGINGSDVARIHNIWLE